MKLCYDKKSDNPTYFVQQGYRNGKKVTTKNIFKIGKHNDLIKAGHADPLSYAKSVVDEYNKKSKSDIADITMTIDFTKKLVSSNNIASNSTLLNIGYYFLQDIYSKLNIQNFLEKVCNDRKITFDINNVNRFITFDRILNPKSKLSTLKDLENFYEKPNIQYQHVLRSLDILADNFDAYLEHLYKNSDNIVKRDTSICYYDCTNYYFETESEDYYVDEVTGEIFTGLRQYGPSKEHRPNPIVEMGLFMDSKGIPITMGIFPGNQNEQTTVKDLEIKMIRFLKSKKIIYCADAGLGSFSIRKLNSYGNSSFIVTQSLKKLSRSLQEKVFLDEGYKLCSSDKNIKLETLMKFDKSDENNLNLYQDKAYKIIETDSLYDLGLYEEKELKSGSKKIVKAKGKLEQRLIIVYSRKVAEYQKSIRNKQIERAKSLISRGVDDIRKGPNDIARFIKKKENKKTEYILDEERIRKEEKFDGFYALATNLLDENPSKIIEINANRNKIEDCFRVLKTNFDARPVYHRLDNRIKAHFLTCYTALLIYRLLEAKLKEKKYYFTVNNILDTLRNMNVTNTNDIFYEACYTSSQVCTALNDVFAFGLDKKYYRPKELSKIIKKI